MSRGMFWEKSLRGQANPWKVRVLQLCRLTVAPAVRWGGGVFVLPGAVTRPWWPLGEQAVVPGLFDVL